MVHYLSKVWPDASMRPRHKAAENLEAEGDKAREQGLLQ